jgi:hypothetical protein
MAENTSRTYLMKSDDGVTYTKLLDITSYPDIFIPPAKMDATTLTNTQKVYIPDIKDVPDLEFGAWYAEADYDAVAALSGLTKYYQLQFGTSGANGKFTWQGDIFATPKGGGVSAVREMTITCYPSTEIVKS